MPSDLKLVAKLAEADVGIGHDHAALLDEGFELGLLIGFEGDFLVAGEIEDLRFLQIFQRRFERYDLPIQITLYLLSDPAGEVCDIPWMLVPMALPPFHGGLSNQVCS